MNPYIKTNWATNDLISAEKLNKIEDGIEAVTLSAAEIAEDLTLLETQVGETIITYANGVVVGVSSDNVVEVIEYDANGEVDKVTSTYADGKAYEETYTKDVNGNITKIMKVEVI